MCERIPIGGCLRAAVYKHSNIYIIYVYVYTAGTTYSYKYIYIYNNDDIVINNNTTVAVDYYYYYYYYVYIDLPVSFVYIMFILRSTHASRRRPMDLLRLYIYMEDAVVTIYNIYIYIMIKR